MMRYVALVSEQGTACLETVLSEIEDTPFARALIEKQFCTGKVDAPLASSWRDVSDNYAIVSAEA